jgi:hypothetical protein
LGTFNKSVGGVDRITFVFQSKLAFTLVGSPAETKGYVRLLEIKQKALVHALSAGLLCAAWFNQEAAF